jgi:hypothetical protein
MKACIQLRKQRIKRLKAFRGKAIARRIQKLNVVRNWNVHASEDGKQVAIVDCVHNLNRLKKTMGLRHKITNKYIQTVTEPTQMWGYIYIQVN